MIDRKYRTKRLTKQRGILAVVSFLLVALMILAACGEAATATPEAMEEPTAVPDEPTAVPDEPDDAMEPTAMPNEPDDAMPEPTATTEAMEETGIRPRSEWTVENPATLEELEAEIENYRGSSFVFTSWGGAYQAAQRQAYVIPFTEKFGIEVVEESPMEYAVINIMVETGNYKWNVMDVGGRELWNHINIGALAELDLSVVDNRNHVDTVSTPYGGGGGITWSTVLAYNSDVYDEGSITTWADFFDREKFPGTRSVRDAYRGSWFSALLANDHSRLDDSDWRARLGAPEDEDVQEALAVWEANPPNHFWHTGSDCPQLLISGDNDMCTAWNGRIYNAQVEGAPLAICWECGHLIGTGAFVMAKGLDEADPAAFDLGQLFIAWTGQAAINADISKYITYGALNLRSAAFQDAPAFDAVRPALPTSPNNAPYSIIEDEQYSGQKNSEWTDLWLAYLQSVGS